MKGARASRRRGPTQPPHTPICSGACLAAASMCGDGGGMGDTSANGVDGGAGADVPPPAGAGAGGGGTAAAAAAACPSAAVPCSAARSAEGGGGLASSRSWSAARRCWSVGVDAAALSAHRVAPACPSCAGRGDTDMRCHALNMNPGGVDACPTCTGACSGTSTPCLNASSSAAQEHCDQVDPKDDGGEQSDAEGEQSIAAAAMLRRAQIRRCSAIIISITEIAPNTCFEKNARAMGVAIFSRDVPTGGDRRKKTYR
jgi:hypothetical protein